MSSQLFTILLLRQKVDEFEIENDLEDRQVFDKKLNSDLQLQADFAISHSYNTNVDYLPHSDCSAVQSRN